MLFLLRLNIGKKPAPAPSSRRVRSPSIGSTLITSAPMSASIMPQVGPITMCVNSTTRRPASGCGGSVAFIGDPFATSVRARAARCASSSASPARHSVPCSVSPSSHCATLRAQRDQRGRNPGPSRRPCWRTGRRRPRWRRCRSRPARAGSRRCRRGRRRSARCPVCHAANTLARPRPRVSWKWPQASRSPAMRERLREQRRAPSADRRSRRCRRGRRARRRRRARPATQAQHFGGLDAALDRAAERGADADLDQARASRARRARRGCARSRRRRRRASCAGWRGCARGSPTAAAASGRRRIRSRARRP